MYLYVSFQTKDDYYRNGPQGRTKARLEAASGERCLIVPYEEIDLRVVRQLSPSAIVMGGFGGYLAERKVSSFFGVDEVLHRADLPVLCICGSHQILGWCFNTDLRRVKRFRDLAMRRLRPDEDVPRKPVGAQGVASCDLSGFLVADGFYPVFRRANDPLFRGLPQRMMLRCSHFCEVKKLPDGFDLLASSGHCRIEAMKRKGRPLYGVQFHPEYYEEPFFHGRTILENFAKLTGAFWKEKRQ